MDQLDIYSSSNSNTTDSMRLMGSSSSLETDWRRHGKARRKQLLRKDEQGGGTSFVINPKCSVKKYFAVAERVLTQFREMYETRNKMEDVYVMGNRLMVFLNEALPQHPQYLSSSSSTSVLREKSRNDSEWIQNRLEVVALRIDEEQLNKFLMKKLRGEEQPQSKQEKALAKPQEAAWEIFSGWSTALAETMEWERAKDVSFESEDLSETSFEVDSYGTNGRHDAEMSGSDSDETKLSFYDLSIEVYQADYPFLGRIEEEEEAFDAESQSGDNTGLDGASTVEEREPILDKSSHRKGSRNFSNESLKQKKLKEDKPGIMLRRLNCFMNQSKTSDLEGEVNESDRKESRYKASTESNTIKTVESDDDEMSLCQKSARCNELRNQTKSYGPGAARTGIR